MITADLLRRLRNDLPTEVQQTLLKHEADGTTDHPAYQEAVHEQG